MFFKPNIQKKIRAYARCASIESPDYDPEKAIRIERSILKSLNRIYEKFEFRIENTLNAAADPYYFLKRGGFHIDRKTDRNEGGLVDSSQVVVAYEWSNMTRHILITDHVGDPKKAEPGFRGFMQACGLDSLVVKFNHNGRSFLEKRFVENQEL